MLRQTRPFFASPAGFDAGVSPGALAGRLAGAAFGAGFGKAARAFSNDFGSKPRGPGSPR